MKNFIFTILLLGASGAFGEDVLRDAKTGFPLCVKGQEEFNVFFK